MLKNNKTGECLVIQEFKYNTIENCLIVKLLKDNNKIIYIKLYQKDFKRLDFMLSDIVTEPIVYVLLQHIFNDYYIEIDNNNEETGFKVVDESYKTVNNKELGIDMDNKHRSKNKRKKYNDEN